MPRWSSTPAPSTHNRSRRGHTRNTKVASKASADHVKRLRSTACSNSHSGATKRWRSSMRIDRRDGGAVVPGAATGLRPRRQQVSDGQLAAAAGAWRTGRGGGWAVAPSDGRGGIHRPPNAARRQQHGDADLPEEQVTRVEDHGVGALEAHEAEHGDGAAQPGLEPHHREQGRHDERQAHGHRGVVPADPGERVPCPRLQVPLVEQRSLGEERVDVGEEADAPHRRHRPPGDPDQRHRRGGLGREEELVPRGSRARASRHDEVASGSTT